MVNVTEVGPLTGLVFSGTLVEALSGALEHIKAEIHKDGSYEVDNVVLNVVTEPDSAPEWQVSVYQYAQ